MLLGSAQECENFIQLFSSKLLHIQLIELDIGYFINKVNLPNITCPQSLYVDIFHGLSWNPTPNTFAVVSPTARAALSPSHPAFMMVSAAPIPKLCTMCSLMMSALRIPFLLKQLCSISCSCSETKFDSNLGFVCL